MRSKGIIEGRLPFAAGGARLGLKELEAGGRKVRFGGAHEEPGRSGRREKGTAGYEESPPSPWRSNASGDRFPAFVR